MRHASCGGGHGALQASNACSLKNRCAEAVVRWRQMVNVL